MYIRHKGADVHPAATSTLPPIEARFRPFLEEHYGCATCHLCSVLLRRYQPAERVEVKTHFDRMAYVTAVASLNPNPNPKPNPSPHPNPHPNQVRALGGPLPTGELRRLTGSAGAAGGARRGGGAAGGAPAL